MADGAQVVATGRSLPQDLDAEASVLAACIDDPQKVALDAVRPILARGDFYADANRFIWDTIIALDAENQPVDVVTIANKLRAEGRLAQIGGTPYLGQLAQAVPATAHLEAHARIVADKARQRSVVSACQRIAAEGYGELGDVKSWALDAAQVVSDIATVGQDDDPAETFAELIPREADELAERARSGQEYAGIDTGWYRLNQIIGGWEEGLMHVLAGRPGMGKTGAVMCACLNVAKQGFGAVFASAEMPKRQLAQRALAVEAHVSLTSIRTGRMNSQEWAAVASAAVRLRDLPISIKYCPGAKVGEIRGVVRAEQRRLPKLGLVAVDYMQILDGERRDNDSREAEVASISKRLTWMAAEFKVPLLAVSQLNRGVEARSNKNKRPSLSDLRESGAIEQDGATVNLLYRDEYYDKDSEQAGTLEWIVAKNRNGPTGTARLAFVAKSTMVANLADDEQGNLYEEQGP